MVKHMYTVRSREYNSSISVYCKVQEGFKVLGFGRNCKKSVSLQTSWQPTNIVTELTEKLKITQ